MNGGSDESNLKALLEVSGAEDRVVRLLTSLRLGESAALIEGLNDVVGLLDDLLELSRGNVVVLLLARGGKVLEVSHRLLEGVDGGGLSLPLRVAEGNRVSNGLDLGELGLVDGRGLVAPFVVEPVLEGLELGREEVLLSLEGEVRPGTSQLVTGVVNGGLKGVLGV